MTRCADFEARVANSIEASIKIKEKLLNSVDLVSGIARVAELLVSAFERGNKLVLFGNGGSAADAQHIAAEFVGRFAFDRLPLSALALSVNSSCVTAIGNDYGFDQIFARQIEALAHADDVAIGISTSGNSANIVQALLVSRQKRLHTIALTGCTGGKVRATADYCLSVPSSETPRIQECHILIGHIIAELVEQTIFYDQSCLLRS